MIENLLMYTCAKHCHKRWSSDKAIAKIKRCSFFASQCSSSSSILAAANVVPLGS